jgi:hypothetical protein
MSRQLVVVNSSEPLPSFDTILNSSSIPNRSSSSSSKDSLSSHQSIQKQTLIVVPPTIKQISSNLILPKTSLQSKGSSINSTEITNNNKRSIHSTDDCLFVRYERESQPINYDQFRFSYVIDEHSPSLHKRLRYVSINDL